MGDVSVLAAVLVGRDSVREPQRLHRVDVFLERLHLALAEQVARCDRPIQRAASFASGKDPERVGHRFNGQADASITASYDGMGRQSFSKPL
jgi:hypothetical protein